jgi:hypothetical protein
MCPAIGLRAEQMAGHFLFVKRSTVFCKTAYRLRALRAA